MDNVSFRYRDGVAGEPVLSRLNLTVKNGELLCVVGPSGSGKSTLLRLIAGLELPDEGTVSIDGRAVGGPGADRMIVFQDCTLFPWMTAKRNVSFAAAESRGCSRREADRLAEEMLRRVGLEDSADKYPCRLSGGMRQRVAIARALAMDTEILLMDEPFASLDARSRKNLQQLLTRLHRDGGKTVVFVTHDIEEALLLADRVVFLHDGTITREKLISPSSTRDRETLRLLRSELLTWFGQDGEDTDEAAV